MRWCTRRRLGTFATHLLLLLFSLTVLLPMPWGLSTSLAPELAAYGGRGWLDVLVADAGGSTMNRFLNLTGEEWTRGMLPGSGRSAPARA